MTNNARDLIRFAFSLSLSDARSFRPIQQKSRAAMRSAPFSRSIHPPIELHGVASPKNRTPLFPKTNIPPANKTP